MFNSITKTIHFAHLGILFIYGLTAEDLCNYYAKYRNAEELCLNFKANIAHPKDLLKYYKMTTAQRRIKVPQYK